MIQQPWNDKQRFFLALKPNKIRGCLRKHPRFAAKIYSPRTAASSSISAFQSSSMHAQQRMEDMASPTTL
jgi:hypothetical protein